ncbi:hypothetical protein [uncultured Alistipes sp.]|jgi:hypothetical protein|uniref:hypothetical protein n=1 Tax=uncultured Alistipes sp. TaxID=538949 RepID=UPI0027D98927|nr:hypothetical protein [uncultured Alistipes sp.]
MKQKLKKLYRGVGFFMLLLTAGVDTENFAALAGWLIAAFALLFIGKSFSFQTNKN